MPSHQPVMARVPHQILSAKFYGMGSLTGFFSLVLSEPPLLYPLAMLPIGSQKMRDAFLWTFLGCGFGCSPGLARSMSYPACRLAENRFNILGPGLIFNSYLESFRVWR